MKHITTKFQKLSTPAAVLVSLGAALVLALALEIGVFQFSYFTQGSGSYAETTLDLSGEMCIRDSASPVHGSPT